MRNPIPKNLAGLVRSLATGKKKKRNPDEIKIENELSTRRAKHHALTQKEFHDQILIHLGSFQSNDNYSKKSMPSCDPPSTGTLISPLEKVDLCVDVTLGQNILFPSQWLKSKICRCRQKRVKLTGSPVISRSPRDDARTQCDCKPVVSPIRKALKKKPRATAPAPAIVPSSPLKQSTSWEEVLHSLQNERRRNHNLALTAGDFEKKIIPSLLLPE